MSRLIINVVSIFRWHGVKFSCGDQFFMIVQNKTPMSQYRAVGHPVAVAITETLMEDGARALAVARVQSFDLVITDINMPNMNGIDLVKELRKRPNAKNTPILILTTESGSELKTEGKAAGATGWIVKPFVPEKLLQVVNKVCA